MKKQLGIGCGVGQQLISLSHRLLYLFWCWQLLNPPPLFFPSFSLLIAWPFGEKKKEGKKKDFAHYYLYYPFPPINASHSLPLSLKPRQSLADFSHWLSISLPTLGTFIFFNFPPHQRACVEPKVLSKAPTPLICLQLADWLPLLPIKLNKHASKHPRNSTYLTDFPLPVTYPTEDRLQPRLGNKATYRVADYCFPQLYPQKFASSGDVR